MSLLIYGGDPTVVAARDELARVAGLLRQAEGALRDAAARSWLQLGTDPAQWLPEIASAAQLAATAPGLATRIGQLAAACDLAAEGYFSTEAQISRRFFASTVSPSLQFGALAASVPAAPWRTTTGVGLAGVTLGLAIAGLVNSPSTPGVQLVRAAAATAPALSGATTVPGLTNQLRVNLALLGVPSASTGLARLHSSDSAMPAGSLAQHSARLHQSYFGPTGGIRVEVYPQLSGTGRQFVVYVPGTQSAALAGRMPLDMGSNLKAMASPGIAASERAVLSALGQLGAGRNDSVLLVGHSQGALIASNIAATRQPFRVSGLISIGGPIAHHGYQTLHPASHPNSAVSISRLHSIPTIAIEHTNDPVPALSGRANPLTENMVTVQREIPAQNLVAAHSMSGYRQTSALADIAADPGLARVRGMIGDQLANLGEGVEYRFELIREPAR
jgi:pimeloyl-ACP methyl ester carboxylesterase